MDVLFFTDLHGDMKTLKTVFKKSENSDLIVCAGDITNMEDRLTDILKVMNKMPKPVLLIHGNHEDGRRLKRHCEDFKNIIYLHKAVHHFENCVFMGYGGDGFSREDNDFIKVSNMFFKEEAKKKNIKILVTHGPPYGTEIDKVNMEYRGNRSYRQFIDEIKPQLVISGHLHENAGKHHKIGKTLFLNPGKEGVIVEI